MAFAASTIIAGLGLAVAAGGEAYSISQSEKAAKANSAAANNQAQIAQLQAGNVDVEQRALQLQTQQQQLQISENQQIIGQQSQAAALQEQAAELDATRRARQAIRQGIVAQATGLTAIVNSGAGQPGSTATKNARADIQGQVNNQELGIAQNRSAGEQLYGIQKNITNISLNAQAQNASYVQQSEALQEQTLNTQKQIYSLGGQASNDFATAALASGNAAIGNGIANLGGSLVSNYSTINRLTNYFSGSSSSTWGAPTGSPYYGPLGQNG